MRYSRDGTVATVTFDRPQARNAMTWRMYEQLATACARIASAPGLRVAVLRGAGGKAFIAGTDIAQFAAFRSAEDGLAYEEKMESYIVGLEALPVPTLAVIEGFAVGGGLAIAAACDLRIATPDARFGVPIARTLGNTLSIAAVARMMAYIGPARTKDLLFTGRLIDAEEGKAAGVFSEVVEPDRVESRTLEVAEQIAANAPLTIRSIKEMVRRLLVHARTEEVDDLIQMAYQSEDFREGVDAFLAKRAPRWKGR